MTVAARLTGIGTLFSYKFDEISLTKPSISSIGTAFAYEFDENVGVAVTLTGSTRMRHLPEVGTASASTFGSLSGSGNWVEGVLANNGKIYGIPFEATEVLEIDPVGLTTSTFGSLSGSSKWGGGVLAPNGKIYGIPFAATEVLEIDPVNQTTSTFGSLGGGWTGGVLAPNGKIYGIPFAATEVLEIDPVGLTTSTFGSLGGGWAGGVLAPNGKIYGIPSDATQVLEIDIEQDDKEIQRVNPQIESIKNNNLVFDLSDSSLSDYKFKLYYDQNYNNEFVSTGSTSVFSVS